MREIEAAEAKLDATIAKAAKPLGIAETDIRALVERALAAQWDEPPA